MTTLVNFQQAGLAPTCGFYENNSLVVFAGQALTNITISCGLCHKVLYSIQTNLNVK